MEQIAIGSFYRFIRERKISHFFNIACQKDACRLYVGNVDMFERAFGQKVEIANNPAFYQHCRGCKKELTEFMISVIVPVSDMII